MRSFLEESDLEDDSRRGPEVVVGAVGSVAAAVALDERRQSSGHKRARTAFVLATDSGLKEVPAGTPASRSISFGTQDDFQVK